jgi:hypothetical protein
MTPKLEYTPVAWNSVTSTDTKKLECIQWKFVPLSQNHFFSYKEFSYDALHHLKLQVKKHYLVALFFLLIFILFKKLSLTDNLRDSPMFSGVKRKNCPLARCIKAATFVCRDVHVFRKPITLVK